MEMTYAHTAQQIAETREYLAWCRGCAISRVTEKATVSFLNRAKASYEKMNGPGSAISWS